MPGIILGRPRGILGYLGLILGPSQVILGPSGLSWADAGPSQNHPGPSWVNIGRLRFRTILNALHSAARVLCWDDIEAKHFGTSRGARTAQCRPKRGGRTRSGPMRLRLRDSAGPKRSKKQLSSLTLAPTEKACRLYCSRTRFVAK